MAVKDSVTRGQALNA